MGQRVMDQQGDMTDLILGQRHSPPEPVILYQNIPNFPPPNVHTPFQAPANSLPPHHDAALFYRLMQYNGVQHPYTSTNPDLVGSTSSNHYNPYTPPLDTRVFAVPLDHGSHHQFPYPNNHGYNQFMDVDSGLYKRKIAEGNIGNFQYSYALAGSSSSSVPGARSLESEVGSYRSMSNIPGGVGLDSSSVHGNNNYLIHGNYQGQPFQTAASPWLDQQIGGNSCDIGTLPWNQAPALPYLHGNINGVCIEAGNVGVQGYPLTTSNRSSPSFPHPPPPPVPHCRPNLNLPPPPPLPGFRGLNMDLHSQGAMPLHRYSAPGSSYSASINPFQDAAEAGPRHLGPVPPTNFRMYRPHRRDVMVEANPRQRNLPHLRVLPEDGVAILEIPGYHEAGDSIDHHRDLRLDIDHMSYEELLALGEQIGNAGSGLSEEIITSRLRTRRFVSETCPKPGDAAFFDQEIDFCVICQAGYKDEEKVGTLDCGHEYHGDCIKKWLLLKNTCPICKSSALAMVDTKHDS